jgi:hypothetical protein
LAAQVNPRAALAAYLSCLGVSSAAALPAGLLPEGAFVGFLRDGLGLSSPSALSSADVGLLVWEFAAAAPEPTTSGAATAAAAAPSGLWVDAASFVDGLALHHRDPEVLLLQRAWAAAIASKPRAPAAVGGHGLRAARPPSASAPAPAWAFVGGGGDAGGGFSGGAGAAAVEARLLQRLQTNAGLRSGGEGSPGEGGFGGDSSGGGSGGSGGGGGGGGSSDGAWRVRRNFRVADRSGGGAVPAEAWFEVLQQHKFQDLLTRAQVGFVFVRPAPRPCSLALAQPRTRCF